MPFCHPKPMQTQLNPLGTLNNAVFYYDTTKKNSKQSHLL
jgi:hypothetical protein